MTITVYKQKTTNKIFLIQKKIPKKDGDFFLQNHEMRPKIESRNSGDQELWNHEMRGSPVFTRPIEITQQLSTYMLVITKICHSTAIKMSI